MIMTLEAVPEIMKSFLQADIFSEVALGESITYRGPIGPKWLRFDVVRDAVPHPFYLVAIISREEKMSWQSFQDLLSHAAGLAQKDMLGLFGLEILSVDIQNGVRHFNTGDFSKLLVNHARNLLPDTKVLIRYGQLFGLLHKRVPAEWGKIVLKTFVEIVDSAKIRPELFVRKLLRETGSDSNAIYGIHDMSSSPLWQILDLPASPQEIQDVPGASENVSSEIYLIHPSLKTPRRLRGT